MMKKLLFAAGAGVGYLLGTRAGREKYDAMVSKARQVANRPDVQEVTRAVKSEASRVYDEGRQRIRAKIQPDQPRHGYDPLTEPTPAARPHANSTYPERMS